MFGLGRIGSRQERATGPVRRVIGRQRLDVQKILHRPAVLFERKGLSKTWIVQYLKQAGACGRRPG